MMVVDMVLFVAIGYLMAKAPGRNVPRHDQLAYLARSGVTVIVLLICLLATIVLVWTWMRQVREDYRQAARKNLEVLIEGTLQDHERKKG